MEKQLSKKQEQDDQENELDANFDAFGNIITSVSEEELRARIDQHRNTDTADSGE